MKKNLLPLVTVLAIFISFWLINTQTPTSCNGMTRECKKYIKEDKLGNAVKCYAKVADIYPKDYKIHLKLANLYMQVEEFEKAKKHYYKAISFGHKKGYAARFALANLYIYENNYNLAEKIILPLKKTEEKKMQEGLGKFYFNLGEKISYQDNLKAISKYELACKYYQKADNTDISGVKNALAKSYIALSDKYILENNMQKATKMLNLSLSLADSSQAHYKLAKIYEKTNINQSMNEYAKVYKCKSNVKIDMSYLPDKNFFINILGIKYNYNEDQDTIIPGISFRISNIGKQPIKYLKLKSVFMINDEELNSVAKPIIDNKSLLDIDSTTPITNLFSSKPIEKQYLKDLTVKILVSQSYPDKWKLFRKIHTY